MGRLARTFVAAAALLYACGGDDSGGGGEQSDSGSGRLDSGQLDSGSSRTLGDGGPLLDGSSDVEAGPDPYCAATIDYYKRCSAAVTQACVTTLEQQCVNEEAVYSAAYVQAKIACRGPSSPCGSRAACEANSLARATPTAAQATLRDHYCATCSSDPQTCSANFYQFGAGGGYTGEGDFALVTADSLVQRMDANCTGSALDAGMLSCSDAFAGCIQKIYSDAVLPIESNCH